MFNKEQEKRLRVLYLCDITGEPLYVFRSLLDDTPPDVVECTLHPDKEKHIAVMLGSEVVENETKQIING